MTHFSFLFSSNKCANCPKYTSIGKIYVKFGSEQSIFCQSSALRVGFANATFYLSSFNLLVLFAFTSLLFTSTTFYSTSSSFRHQ